MTKDEEIKLLKKLADGETYFSDEFRHHINRMCDNIKNDFPLLLDTPWSNYKTEAQIAQDDVARLTRDIDVHKEEIEFLKGEIQVHVNTKKAILDEMVLRFSQDVYSTIPPHTFFGEMEIIKSKIRQGIALNKEEKELVFSVL